MRELGLLRRAELGNRATVWKVRFGRLGAPAAECVPRANGGASADQFESGNPVEPVVEDVPQCGQDAVWFEDSAYLASRDVHVEPVHGVARYHGIDGRVR